MSTTLNMHSLIHHFEERLRQIDRQNLGDVTGKEPHFPQLVVYLGKDASDAHTAVSTNLLQIWPQYQDELKFLCIQKTDGNTYAAQSSVVYWNWLSRNPVDCRRGLLPPVRLPRW